MKRPRYQSDIPAEATAHEVAKARRKGNSIYLRVVEYRVGDRIVGKRRYDLEGRISSEVALKDGLAHGRCYEFFDSGRISCVEPCADGQQHGTCHQWDEDGTYLGRYVLRHGTGFDVWRHRDARGRIYEGEVRTFRDGRFHGYEWWLHGDRLSSECHFVGDKRHGIERSWSYSGGLEDGYPRYWIVDEQVDLATYLKAADSDHTLPKLRPRDNGAKRRLPRAVRVILEANRGQ